MGTARSTLSISLDTRPALIELNRAMAQFFRHAAESMEAAAEAHEAEVDKLMGEIQHDSPKHPFIPEVPQMTGDLEPFAAEAAEAARQAAVAKPGPPPSNTPTVRPKGNRQ